MTLRVLLLVVLVKLGQSQTETVTEDPECVARTSSSDLLDCLVAYVSFEVSSLGYYSA
jgi:hypothetical protein